MHWKLKAIAQNVIASLPEGMSHSIYYRMQRRLGGLRQINPTKRLEAGIKTWRTLLDAGEDPTGKVFFEIGTGRIVNVPLAFWLMGAGRTITVDLNPYLKEELILDSIRYIASNPSDVRQLFGDLLQQDRFNRLVALAADDRFQLTAFLDAIGVEYHAPSDAGNTGLPDSCIDYHTSYTVMEHISPAALSEILNEGRRLLRPTGMAVHGIDYSDHFSHNDPNITAVNFLRYSPGAWDGWAGNRYMYMNRMRHADYCHLFDSNDLELTFDQTVTDSRSLEALRSGVVVPHKDYADRSIDELATTSSWIVAKPRQSATCAAA